MGWGWVAGCWQAAACLQGGPPTPSPFLLLLLLLSSSSSSSPPPSPRLPPPLPPFLPSLSPPPWRLAHTRDGLSPPLLPLSLSLSLSLPLPPPGAPASAAPPFPNAARRPGCVCRGVEEGAEGGGLRVARVWVCGCRVRERATAGARPLPLPRPLALPRANGGREWEGWAEWGEAEQPRGRGACLRLRPRCGVWCVVCGVWCGVVGCCVCVWCAQGGGGGGWARDACLLLLLPRHTTHAHAHTHTHTHSTPRRGAAQPRVTYSGSRNGLCWGVCRLYLGARGWRRRRRGRGRRG